MWHLVATIIQMAFRKDNPEGEDFPVEKRRDQLKRSIPNVAEAKTEFGTKFNILHKIFNSHDIVPFPSLMDDPKKYETVVVATLYDLPNTQNANEVSLLLTDVMSMWFGKGYWDLQRKKELDQDVFTFKTVNFFGMNVKSENQF
jgi:hypothetical protein